MSEIAGVNTASLGGYFVVQRQGPDGRKGPMNSTATYSTWRGMGSARLYFAQDSPCDDNSQPYHTGLVATLVKKDRAFRRTPGRRCPVCYWCIIEDSRKRFTIGTWKTRTLRAAGKLQELTHEIGTDGTSSDSVK